MRRKKITATAVALLLLSMSFVSACNSDGSQKSAQAHEGKHAEASPTAAASDGQTTASGRRIPAHFKKAPDPKTLPPTLPPEKFTGETRDAYQVAKEIPVTLAQLPCFCYCDAIGHKSLHSCYEDDHSAGCGICKVSALMASKLKKDGLSDEQIRDRLIAHFQ
jgi:hypothetical protein